MKKNNLKVTLVAVFTLVGGYNVYSFHNLEVVSELVRANVDALASDNNDDWYCVGETKVCLKDDQGTIHGKKYVL